jgi:DNA-binding transcriptional MerR regulator
MTMQIGELARRFALNPKTIRFYEEIGLLPRPKRTGSGYRQYDEAAVSALAFIQRAKLLGLSLEDIRDILAAHAHGEQPCARVLALVEAEISRIDQHIAHLASFRADLAALRATWSALAKPSTDPGCLCPIIERQTDVGAQPALEPLQRRAEATTAR